ncbi:MAG TPA: calcium-binding protein [Actinomycetota bacterium]|nr:calcium-binding protein [Actinomycetota bacterium]
MKEKEKVLDRLRAWLVALAVVAAQGVVVVGDGRSAGAAARPTCFGKKATIVVRDGYESVDGTNGDDVIVGTSSTDYIDGKGGNDRICARSNHPADEDFVSGGGGDDRISGGRSGDSLNGGRGDDLIVGGRGYDYIWAELGADTVRGGAESDYVDGGIGWDVIEGGGDGDGIVGGAGRDTLDGGAGSDLVSYAERCCDYSYDAGSVEVDLTTGVATGADGTDSIANFEGIQGSDGDDVLIGDDGPNRIYALNGEDEVHARGGDDRIVADDIGGVGDDHVDGGEGSDTIGFDYVAVTVDLVAGTARGQGTDTLVDVENVIGSIQGDTIYGDDESNRLLGYYSGYDSGDDEIHGAGGDDYLEGGDGTDRLDGGDGNDTCTEGESVQSCESTTPPDP